MIKPKILACTLFVLFLLGCFGKAPENRYYLLDYVPTPARLAENSPPLPVTLRVKNLNVDEAYSRPELVYRQSAHELRFYNYHQWAVKPEHLITDMVFKHIRTSNLFKSTTRTLMDFKPDYSLTGQVLALEEYDNQDKWFAHLSINFQLADNRSRAQIWNKMFDVRKEVAQHEPVFVVRELSYLLEHIMDKVVEELENTLSPSDSKPETSADNKTIKLKETTTTNKNKEKSEKEND